MSETDQNVEIMLSLCALCALCAKMTPDALLDSIDWEKYQEAKKKALGERE